MTSITAVQPLTSRPGIEQQTRKHAAPTAKPPLAALLEFDAQAASAVGVFFGAGSSASHGIFCNLEACSNEWPFIARLLSR